MRWCALLVVGLLLLHSAMAQTPTSPLSPWGVSSSAGSAATRDNWLPEVSGIGVRMARTFPSWRSIENEAGQFDWTEADRAVALAKQNNVELTGILFDSAPGREHVHAFPMQDLDRWANYVSKTVARYKNDIRYWEVWNEGNAAFNDEHHTTKDYAQLAATAYKAAKAANPDCQVGLSVASYDAPYLIQTIIAMREQGTPDSFDYLCIHPYEIADGLRHRDGEIPFLWMTQLLCDTLKKHAPTKADAPIWITEVGHCIGTGEPPITDDEAAEAIVKIYTLALAQGISQVQWFEAQDAQYEQAGFGLIDREGKQRPSFAALRNLIAVLGENPQYLGWVELGNSKRGYGFVFQSAKGQVTVAWAQHGMRDMVRGGVPETRIEARNAITGALTERDRGNMTPLTSSPLIVTCEDQSLVMVAKDNAKKPFPWGGNFAAAKTVSCDLSNPDAHNGILWIENRDEPVVTFADGTGGIVMKGLIDHSVGFVVHPSFADLDTSEYWVRITVRRLSEGNAGMNLRYEVADTQGGSPYTGGPGWYSIPDTKEWTTHTWHITGASFAKMWGRDISIHPELSVPFVLGKVEASTQPFAP